MQNTTRIQRTLFAMNVHDPSSAFTPRTFIIQCFSHLVSPMSLYEPSNTLHYKYQIPLHNIQAHIIRGEFVELVAREAS